MNPVIDWAAILSILVLVVLAYLQLVYSSITFVIGALGNI